MIKVEPGFMVPLADQFPTPAPEEGGYAENEDSSTANWVSQCLQAQLRSPEPPLDVDSFLSGLVPDAATPDSQVTLSEEPEPEPERLPKAWTPASPGSPCSSDSSHHRVVSSAVPRHKRPSHKRAELKRRDKIKDRLDELKAEVPYIADKGKMSESAILSKAAEYAMHLKGDCERFKTEAANLRREIESLSSEIHSFQEHLPATGLQQELMGKATATEEERYASYVTTRTNESWKFFIFTYLMRPLFEKYKKEVKTKDADSFSESVNAWTSEALGLTNLRHQVLENMRVITRTTNILTSPETLPEEAMASISLMSAPTKGAHHPPSKRSPTISKRSPTTPAPSSATKIGSKNFASDSNPASFHHFLTPTPEHSAPKRSLASPPQRGSQSKTSPSFLAPLSEPSKAKTSGRERKTPSPRGSSLKVKSGVSFKPSPKADAGMSNSQAKTLVSDKPGPALLAPKSSYVPVRPKPAETWQQPVNVSVRPLRTFTLTPAPPSLAAVPGGVTLQPAAMATPRNMSFQNMPMSVANSMHSVSVHLPSAPMAASMHCVPMVTSFQSVPMVTPMESAPMARSMQSVPMATSMQSAPMATSMQSAPMGTSMQSAPMATSMQSAPMATSMQSAPMATTMQYAPMGTSRQSVPMLTRMQSVPMATANQGQATSLSLQPVPMVTSMQSSTESLSLQSVPMVTSMQSSSENFPLQSVPMVTSLQSSSENASLQSATMATSFLSSAGNMSLQSVPMGTPLSSSAGNVTFQTPAIAAPLQSGSQSVPVQPVPMVTSSETFSGSADVNRLATSISQTSLQVQGLRTSVAGAFHPSPSVARLVTMDCHDYDFDITDVPNLPDLPEQLSGNVGGTFPFSCLTSSMEGGARFISPPGASPAILSMQPTPTTLSFQSTSSASTSLPFQPAHTSFSAGKRVTFDQFNPGS